MGTLIIREVVRELLGKGLSGAKVLLLAGSRWAGQGLGWECGWKGEDGAEPGQTHGQEAQQHGASLRFGSRVPCGWKLSRRHFWLHGCWV